MPGAETHTEHSPHAGASVCILWQPPGSDTPLALVESLRRHGAEIRSARDPYAALTLACRATRPAADAPPGGAPPRAILILLVDPPALPDPAGFIDAVRRYAPRSACWWYHSGASPAFRAVTPADLDAWRAPRAAPDLSFADTSGHADSISPPGVPSPAAPRSSARSRSADPQGPLRRMNPQAQPAAAAGHGPPRLRLTHADAQRPSAPSPTLVPQPEPKPQPRPVPPPLTDSDTHEHDHEPDQPLLTAEELAILLGDADDPLPPDPPAPPTPPTAPPPPSAAPR